MSRLHLFQVIVISFLFTIIAYWGADFSYSALAQDMIWLVISFSIPMLIASNIYEAKARALYLVLINVCGSIIVALLAPYTDPNYDPTTDNITSMITVGLGVFFFFFLPVNFGVNYLLIQFWTNITSKK